MSYILDALQRADTERERSATPGLRTRHTLPTHVAWVDNANKRWGWLAAASLLTLVLLGIGWLWQGGARQPATMNPPAPAISVSVPPPTRQKPASAIVNPLPSAPEIKAVALPQLKTSTHNIPLLGELPESTRNQIPKITITGSVYSNTPSQRLLLVNNQVLAQGSLVAPELTLEEIHTNSSVFSHRGTRFRVAH